MKRRIFAVILSCLMVLSLIPFAAFAADEHKHSYTETVVIEATCTTTGIKKLTCACGDTKYEPISKHKLDAGVVKEEADCVTAGSVEKTCTVCGEKVVEEIAPFGHKYAESVKTATCESPAMVGSYCTRCGEQDPEADDPVAIGEKVDHFFKANSKYVFDMGTEDEEDDVAYSKADCTVSGYAFEPCIYCGKLEEEIGKTPDEIVAIADEILTAYYDEAAGHKWNDGVAASGKCDKEGCNGFTHTIFTCTVCGGKTIDLATEKDVPSDDHAANHTYKVSKKEATCTADGKYVYTCSHCGDSYTEIKKKLGHDYDYTVEKEEKATCTTTGYYYYVCANGCGVKEKKVDENDEVIVIEINPANHGKNETRQEVMVPNTCTSSGIAKEFCKGCNAFVGYAPIDPAHTEKAGTSVIKEEKTCTKPGLRTYECAVCGKTIEEVIPASHNNKTEIIQEATCTAAGSKLLTCLDCGFQETKEIKKLAHSYKTGYFAPDCVNPGRTGKICTVCGTASGTVTIHEDEPALGHKIKETVVAATCYAPTSVKRACTVCDYVQIVEIPGVSDKLEHDVDTSVEKVHREASCTEDEADIYVCKRCGEFEVIEDGYEEAFGHDMEKDVHVEATCSTYGYYADICKNECGLEENVRILNAEAPDGKTHQGVLSDSDFVLAPDCVTGATGIARVVCKLCGEYTTDADGNAYGVAPIKHNFKDGRYVKTPATCTTNGTYGYKCTVCGVEATATDCSKDNYNLTTTIKAAHTWGSSIVISDTVCGGIVKERTCIVCSTVNQYQSKGDEGTGVHVYETKVFAKTCTVDAYVADACVYCGDETNITIVDDGDEVNGYYGTNHEKATGLITQIKAATCDAPKQIQQYCPRCEKVVSSTPDGDPLGHSAVPTDADEIYEVKATCEKDGYTFYICTKCDKNVEISTENRLNCAIIDGVTSSNTKKVYLTGKKTTCVDGGYYTVACKNCGKNVSDEVIFEASKGTEHSDNKVEILVPTCTSKGIRKDTCKYCNRVKFETLDIRHTLDAGVRVNENECSASTKDKDKIDCLFSCTLCDYTVVKKATKGHEYGSWKVSVEATCLPGSQYRVCKVCGYEQTKKIDPVAEHIFSEDDLYIPATCQEGIKIGIACTVCHTPKTEWAYVGAELAAHETTETHVPADCVNDEHFLIKCKNCDYEQKITFEGGAKATGHTAGAAVYNGDGFHTTTCTVCGDVVKQNCFDATSAIITALPEFEDLANIHKVEANCKQGEHWVLNCLECGEKNALLVSDDEDYAVTGEPNEDVHAYDVKTVLLAPTCATAGIYKLTCSCDAENVPATYAPAPKLPTHTYGEQLTSAGKYTTMYEVCSVCEYIHIIFSTKGSAEDEDWGLTEAEKNCLVGKHVVEVVDRQDPTLCEDGVSSYKQCAVCETLLSEKTAIPAPHHYEVVSEGFDANGEYVVMYQCTECDKTKVDVH